MPTQQAVGNRHRTDRGQTGIDFVVGVAIFLLATAFVFGFVPGMLAPFGEATATPIYGDRIVDDLVYDTLADGSDPGVLSKDQTLSFFENGPETTRTIIDLPELYDYNISLLEVDSNGARIPLYRQSDNTISTQASGTRLATGEPVPVEYGSVTSVGRHVRIGDTDAVLVVRVW